MEIRFKAGRQSARMTPAAALISKDPGTFLLCDSALVAGNSVFVPDTRLA